MHLCLHAVIFLGCDFNFNMQLFSNRTVISKYKPPVAVFSKSPAKHVYLKKPWDRMICINNLVRLYTQSVYGKTRGFLVSSLVAPIFVCGPHSTVDNHPF